MKRTTISKLKLDEEELRNVLDECYKDTKNLKNEISLLYEDWKAKTNEIGEIAVVGNSIIKLLDLRDKNIDKKLKIAQEIFKFLEKSKPVEPEKKGEGVGEEYTIPQDVKSQISQILASKNKRN